MCMLCNKDYDNTVTYLNISHCVYISELPDNLINLKVLHCYDCPNLIYIPNLPQLTNLNCYNCPKLLNISDIAYNQNE